MGGMGTWQARWPPDLPMPRNPGEKSSTSTRGPPRGTDDDGRSAQRPVAQNTTINLNSGVPWRHGQGMAAAEGGTGHRGGDATHMSEAAARRPLRRCRGLRACENRMEDDNPTRRCIVGRRRVYRAAGTERSGRGQRHVLRYGRRVDGHGHAFRLVSS